MFREIPEPQKRIFILQFSIRLHRWNVLLNVMALCFHWLFANFLGIWKYEFCKESSQQCSCYM